MSINFFRAFRHFDSFILVEIHAHNLCAVNAFLFAWKRTIVTTTAINDIDWYHPNEMDVKWHKQWEYYDRTQISLVVIHDSWTIFEYIMTPFCTIPADIVGVFSNINSMPCTLWTISFTHCWILDYQRKYFKWTDLKSNDSREKEGEGADNGNKWTFFSLSNCHTNIDKF